MIQWIDIIVTWNKRPYFLIKIKETSNKGASIHFKGYNNNDINPKERYICGFQIAYTNQLNRYPVGEQQEIFKYNLFQRISLSCTQFRTWRQKFSVLITLFTIICWDLYGKCDL